MAIVFQCEQCAKPFEVDDRLAGKRGKCARCGNVFIIPSATIAPPAPRTSSRPAMTAQGPAPSRSTSSASKPARRPKPAPAVDDPYGFDDEDEAPLPSLSDLEDEVPVRAPIKGGNTSRKKSSRRRYEEYGPVLGLPAWGFLFLCGVIGAISAYLLLAQTFPSTSPAIMISTFMVGGTLTIVGGILGLFRAFDEKTETGLLYLFIPIYRLYYLTIRWGVMRAPFFMEMGGVAITVGGLLYLPAFSDAKKAAEQARQNNAALAFKRDNPGLGQWAPPPAPAAPGGGPNAPAQDVGNRRSPSGLRYEQDINNLVSILDQATALYDSMRDRRSLLRGESRLRRMEMQLKMTFGLRPHRTMIFASGEIERLKATHGERVRSALTRLFAAQDRFRKFTNQPPVVSSYPRLADGRPDIDILFPAGVPVGDPIVAAPSPAPAQDPSEPAGNRGPQNVVGRPAAVDGPAPASGDFTDIVLHDLSSTSPQARKAALVRLSRAPANDRREEVAKAVEPILKDPEAFDRTEAAKVLAVWGGPETVPALVKALKDPEVFVRWAVLDALKMLKDPESADAIADAMKSSPDRGKAVEALREIGTPAEDAVLKCLNSGDTFVRMDACKILADIGTNKSIPALRKLSQRRHGLDSMAARDALQALGARADR